MISRNTLTPAIFLGIAAALLLAAPAYSSWLFPRKGKVAVKKDRIVVGFYMPFGQHSPPLKTLSQNTDAISVISPTWFLVKDTDCTTVDSRDTTLSDFCAKNKIKVWPLIANGGFTYDSFHPLITDPEKRNALVNKVVDLMSSCKDCQGINLDFEGINPEDRGAYNELLKLVSEKLHAKSYLVTIDVPAKTKDDPAAKWPGAFDYKEINKYCDYIFIMTYDENVPGYGAGPISSANWVDKVLAYATSVIPKEKILMGVPFYGYDWAEDMSATSFNHVTAMETVKKTGAKVQWDEKAQSPWFTYTDDAGKKRTAWFENRESIAAKLKIADKYGVAGICIWSLGNEDPGIWDEIRKYKQPQIYVPK